MTNRHRVPFANELHGLGFIRIGNSSDPLMYAKLEGRRRIEVQLWKDGRHRATNWLAGTMSTSPSSFVTVAQMREAIVYERIRTDHTHTIDDASTTRRA